MKCDGCGAHVLELVATSLPGGLVILQCLPCHRDPPTLLAVIADAARKAFLSLPPEEQQYVAAMAKKWQVP